jgi:sensor domain CHASE-containing protein
LLCLLTDIFLARPKSYLDKTAKDWAHRDDTYSFVLNKNKDFIRDNLNDGVFKNFGISLALIFDIKGNLIIKS